MHSLGPEQPAWCLGKCLYKALLGTVRFEMLCCLGVFKQAASAWAVRRDLGTAFEEM